ncbi:MAG: tetratricopeptide repeat protein [Prevotella sp.]|nr:tetratricopeptide repeat protein [Prevotella sp.]
MKKYVFSIIMSMISLTVLSQNTVYSPQNKFYSDNLYASAVAGDARAQYTLGECYMKGRGVAVNEEMGVYWYAKAASQNYPLAQYFLGECYMKGKGVNVNENMAISLYNKALNNGLYEAYIGLANYYNRIKDYANAVICHKGYLKYDTSSPLAAAAFHNLGDCYYYGNGIQQDYAKAFDCFIKASNLNDYNAVYRVGEMYYSGKYVQQDYKKAFEYLDKAASHNVARALYMIGMEYYKGGYYTKDWRKAANSFTSVLKDKYIPDGIRGDVCNKLSICYRYGRNGIEQNEELSNYYSVEAQKYGNPDASKIQEWLRTN